MLLLFYINIGGIYKLNFFELKDWKIQYDESFRVLKSENEFILLNEFNDTVLIGTITKTDFMKLANPFYGADIEVGNKILNVLLKEDTNLTATNFSDTYVTNSEIEENI